jgi:small subunit ribosomal protein S16
MVKIRLRRMGKRNRAFYRVVVSDSRSVPTASALEELGYYDPVQEPAIIQIDRERVDYWLGQGAQISSTVKSLLDRVPEASPAEATAADNSPADASASA